MKACVRIPLPLTFHPSTQPCMYFQPIPASANDRNDATRITLKQLHMFTIPFKHGRTVAWLLTQCLNLKKTHTHTHKHTDVQNRRNYQNIIITTNIEIPFGNLWSFSAMPSTSCMRSRDHERVTKPGSNSSLKWPMTNPWYPVHNKTVNMKYTFIDML